MSLRRSWFAGLFTVARRALLLGDNYEGYSVEQANITPTSLGSSWVFEVRIRRNDTRTAYAVIFSTPSFIDAFGLYSGFGPGGYTFFCRDSQDRSNFSLAITSASQSPVGQFQTIRVVYSGGWLRGYYDGQLGFERNVGAFYYDAPTSLVVGFRSGAPVFSGAVDYMSLSSDGVALFEYTFNEVSGAAFNTGTAGGWLDNVYYSLERELLTT